MVRVIKQSDKYIPLYFVAFFAVLILVDGSFAYMAISTHRGVVTENPYQKGLAYNKTVAASEAQTALGWRGQIALNGNELVFSLADANGQPIVGAKAEAFISRPMQAGMDAHYTLQPKGETYSAMVDFPLQGQWDVKVSSIWKQQSFQTHQRIIIP